MSEIYRTALPPGTRIEEYRIERVLGAGGFGTTYLAQDELLAMRVAIKEYLPADLAVREGDLSVHPRSGREEELYAWGLKRFREEAQTLARFDHRNIVRVLRFLSAHKTAYMVMQYEEGESLREVLAQGTLTESELKELMLPLLDGLEVVHKLGVLHRDIKPGNIYIRRDGSPVLLDFGAARQAVGERSRSMTAVLTPPYAPIEQYGKTLPQGPWTDIYALGVVAYQALSAKLPPDATDRAMGEDELEPLSRLVEGRVSARVLAAIEAALQTRAGGRPQSIAQWRGMLWPEARSRANGNECVEEDEQQRTERLEQSGGEDKAALPSWWARHRRRLVIGMAALLLVIFAAGGSLVALKIATERERRAAEATATQTAEVQQHANDAMARAKAAQDRAEAAQKKAEEAARNAQEVARQAKAAAKTPADGKGLGVAAYPTGESYEGQWLNGKRHGAGIAIWKNASRYEGEWRDDLLAGYGIFSSPNSGSHYEGEFAAGRQEGVGVVVAKDGVYAGELRGGKKEGYGFWKGSDGDQYFGEWHDDQESGYGVEITPDGQRYQGQQADNRWSGRGVLTQKDGSLKAGIWSNWQWVRALTPEDR